MTISEALPLANRIVGALTPYCQQIQIAGSIRRLRPIVNDIDLVVLPYADQVANLRERCTANNAVVLDGPQNLIVRTKAGVQVDIFIAAQPRQELFTNIPTNFGSLFLCRTGSVAHNIFLVERAKRLGLIWDPYHGVFRGTELIASATEEEIFVVLDLDFIAPERRER